MIVGPLRDDMRIALVAILLKPGLDVGRRELAFFGAAGVRDDRSEHPRDAIAKQIVRGGQRGRGGSRSIVGSRRGPRPEILVLGERLRDLKRPDRLTVG